MLNRTATTLPELPVETPPTRPAPQLRPVPSQRPSRQPQPRGVYWVAGLAVALLAIALAVWAATRAGRNASAGLAAGATVVERRDFVHVLRVGGTVQAVRSFPILAPRLAGSRGNQMVITKLAPAGTKVKQGDKLAEFDRQSQVQDYMDRQAEYQDLVDQIAKKKSDEAAARAKDDTELKAAEDELDKDKLEVQKEPILSHIDAAKNKLNVEAAEANLKQLRATYALKRQAAEADIHDLEIQRDSKQAAMLHARHNEEQLSLRSPTEGIVVLNTTWKNDGMGEVQEGDQVWGGMPFMQVVDPTRMEIRANVNQMDAPYLRSGQRVEIHLDAYPGVTFTGKLEQFSPIALGSEFSDKLWQSPAVFSIDQSDPRLMPDLSAAVDVELDRVPNALVVPCDAIFTEKSQAYVRVKSGVGSEKRAVKVGPMSDVEAVVEAGVQSGEVVERQ
ncbi:MAG: efflux RND transporter periplasmic adaptor subunit [Terriglobia bacterium]